MTKAEQASTGHGGALDGMVFEMIRGMVPRHLQSKVQMQDDTLLTDLGIGSMAKISLAYQIEKELGVDLSSQADKVAEVQTIGDVRALIRSLVR